MPRFSQRIGVRPIRDAVQIGSVDVELRTDLWNAMGEYCFPKPNEFIGIGRLRVRDVLPNDRDLLTKLWLEYLHWPHDDFVHWDDVRARLKQHFFGCEWYDALDLVEFVARIKLEKAVPWQKRPSRNPFVQACNKALKQHHSAYRFIRGYLARVTSAQEVAAIEDALQQADAIQPVRDHLDRALALLSNHRDPDYRNSIKESISAVEALCKQIAGEPQATLGSALNAIQRSGKVALHSSQRML